MIQTQIIADSLNDATGDRLTTYRLVYPRYIHAELMTHRVFSRNAASSRAIPVAKFRKDVTDNPVIPTHWGANQKGMQAAAELDDTIADHEWLDGTAIEMITQREYARRLWMIARDRMLDIHERLDSISLHKQIANRILEPWFHIEIICSATEYVNWFALRSHDAAHPDIQALSDSMLKEYVEHKPKVLHPGHWHLPYGDKEVPENLTLDTVIKVCVARCARVSYKNFNGEINVEDDLRLVGKLSDSFPLHMSPFEHPAQAMEKSEWSGNFKGWLQFRKTFKNENSVVNLQELYERRILKKAGDTLHGDSVPA
jgi:thymidylate synthase ThyX